MKMGIERCEYWNGLDSVCDAERCASHISERKAKNDICYHRPFLVNHERRTVLETMGIVFGLLPYRGR